jgi:hypothetical protein
VHFKKIQIINLGSKVPGAVQITHERKHTATNTRARARKARKAKRVGKS